MSGVIRSASAQARASGPCRLSVCFWNTSSAQNAVAKGIAVTWLHHRGPGAVGFEPTVPPITNGTKESQ